MKIDEIISSLEEQAQDKDLLDNGEGDIFARDAEVLRQAARLLGMKGVGRMKLFEKLFCCHDWEVIHAVDYMNGADILLKCRKCGRITKRCI